MNTNRKPFDVRIPSHIVGPPPVGLSNGSYAVPESERRVYASSRSEALRRAVRAAHVEEGVPPFISLLRQTVRIASIVPTQVDEESGIEIPPLRDFLSWDAEDRASRSR